MIAPFVSAAWLTDHLDETVVVHVGTTMGGSDPSAAFQRQRIASAVTVVLDAGLAAAPAAVVGRHPLPSAEHFADAMERIGISDDDTVVAYDDGNGSIAARLVWMLRILGQDAALLDGGLAGWDGQTDAGPAGEPDRTGRRARAAWPDIAIADGDHVQHHLDDGGVVIDSRAAIRYRGENEPIDAIAGHVPGAINRDFTDNLDDDMKLLAPDVLRERFAPVDADERSIVYCGSGVTACHNALAIEAAGLPLPRVYVGSWSGWSTEPGRPVATGP